uniref:cellulose binding domain-containing protein n=1 Tax=Allorhizocola rhizosphaerae TaxID=1872709 RepID=UPI00147902C5
QVGTSTTTTFTNTGLSANTSYCYRVTASNTNGTSGPSNTVTATTTGGGGGGCTATATVQSQWGNGYVVQPVTVTNTGTSAITGWRVTFTLPAGHTIVGMWNATPTGSGTITATNLSYNGNLGPSGSTSFGFQVSRPNGNTQLPSGYTCTAS